MAEQGVDGLFLLGRGSPLLGWASPERERELAAGCARVGLSNAAAASRAAMAVQCAHHLLGAGTPPDAEARAFHVPGRVELWGKHTDYAGGRSVLAATERGFVVVAVARTDLLARIHRVKSPSASSELSTDHVRPALLDLAASLIEDDGAIADLDDWSLYPLTALRRLARNFGRELACGADIAFACDLPAAAGLSSSSALITATALALIAANRLNETSALFQRAFPPTRAGREAFAEYLGCVENGQSWQAQPHSGEAGRLVLDGARGVGTFGGSEDHTAIVCCRPGCAELFSFCPVRHEGSVSVGSEHVLVIGCSGYLAHKAAGARDDYNAAAASVAAALAAWHAHTGKTEHATLAMALASSPCARGRLVALLAAQEAKEEALLACGESVLSGCSDDVAGQLAHGQGDPASRARLPPLALRVEQFAVESDELAPAALRAFAARDLAALGELAARSHSLGDAALRNQVEETRLLVRLALAHGAHAASPFGAGFGGSVWAWVDAARADAFTREWQAAYLAKNDVRREMLARSVFFTSPFGPGAFEMANGCTWQHRKTQLTSRK